MRPNRGAVVRSLSAEDVLEVYFMLSALGVLALRSLIGSGPSVEQVEQLEKLENARRPANRRTQARRVGTFRQRHAE